MHGSCLEGQFLFWSNWLSFYRAAIARSLNYFKKSQKSELHSLIFQNLNVSI